MYTYRIYYTPFYKEDDTLLQNYFSGATLHAWALPALILLCSLIAGFVIDRLIQKKLLPQGYDNTPESFSQIAAKALRYMPIAWCLILGIYWALSTIDIAPTVKEILSLLLKTLILLSNTITIARIIIGAMHYYLQRNAENLSSSSLLTHLMEVVIYSCGFMIILHACGISIAPILTALGIGGMAVAIALQDTLTNFFAGVQLLIMKPIRVGDFIKLSSGEEGVVIDINFRHTSIQEVNLGMIIIPNQKIASATLMNYDLPHREIFLMVPCGVSYDSDLDLVERIAIEVAKDVMEKLSPNNTFEPFVRYNAFGESSIDFNVILRTDNVAQRSQLRHEFIKALTIRFREEQIDIPFPSRTLYMSKSSE